MTTSRQAGAPAGRLDAAIAAGAYEVVALRLALGVLCVLDEASAGAAATRDELLALLTREPEGGPSWAPFGRRFARLRGDLRRDLGTGR